jgi:amidohydrolase
MPAQELKKQIWQEAQKIKEELILWRRHIHQFPELSGEEYNTAEFIVKKLKEFGIEEIYPHYADTPSVVAYIRKDKKAPTVALRADIDALPIEEKNEVPYKSRIEGVMHACGHDAHTAMVLGAAKILQKFKDRLKGNVKLIFQSCEENPACSGAKKLVEYGVCDDIWVIFGLHVYPEIESGKIGVRKGPMMAAADFFRVRIIGKSAHASKPHMGIDPVLMAAQAINTIHHIVSRKVNPFQPVVVTIGKIRGGYAPNQIPDEVVFEGTVRTFDENIRKQVKNWIEKAVWGTTLSYGGAYKYEYIEGYPPVTNDEKVTKFGIKVIKELLGEEGFVELSEPSMGGEDFAFYLKKVPGAYFRLGIRNEKKGIIHPLHSSKFDIDEDTLPIGAAFLAYLAYRWLEEHN